MKLRTMPDLAAEIGASEWYVRMMHRAGFPMPGKMSTAEWAFEWLKEHPDFTPSDYQRVGQKKGLPRQEPKAEGKHHSQFPMRAPHTPSPSVSTRRSARDVLRQSPG